MVSVDYGWWHPEWGADERLGGMDESNANHLTRCEVGEPMIGSWSYNAIPCDLRLSEEPLSWVSKNDCVSKKG